MVDWDKPIQTRDGRKARFVQRLKNRGAEYLAIVEEGNGAEFAYEYVDDGKIGTGYAGVIDPLDIINVPEKRVYERWVNVHEDGNTYSWSNRGRADGANSDHYNSPRVACLHIVREYEEGEGL